MKKNKKKSNIFLIITITSFLIFLIIAINSCTQKDIIIITTLIAILALLAAIYYAASYSKKYYDKKEEENYYKSKFYDNKQDFISANQKENKQLFDNYQYYQKNLLTECEKHYYKILKNILKDSEYNLQAQINLASIIGKGYNSYVNELFRNIDFGIFNEDLKCILLIEINDNSHNSIKRQERDEKVKIILQKANIPLLTIWTDEYDSEEYIKRKIQEFIELN